MFVQEFSIQRQRKVVDDALYAYGSLSTLTPVKRLEWLKELQTNTVFRKMLLLAGNPVTASFISADDWLKGIQASGSYGEIFIRWTLFYGLITAADAGRTKNLKDKLQAFFYSCSPKEYSVYSSILRKKLPCKEKLITQVFPEVVKMFQAMKPSDDAVIEYPCGVEPRLHGLRCIAMHMPKDCRTYSSSGKAIIGAPKINELIFKLFPAGTVLDGVLVPADLKVNLHAGSQALFNVKYYIFDIISQEHWEGGQSEPYGERRIQLNRLKEVLTNTCLLCYTPSILVEDEKELEKVKNFMLKRPGLVTGVMVKSLYNRYKQGEVNDIFEVKKL